MDKRENLIALVAKDGYRGEFCIEQATTLIESYGWKIEEGSPYKYDKENGIRLKPNKGVDKQAEQKPHASEDEDDAETSPLSHGGEQVS